MPRAKQKLSSAELEAQLKQLQAQLAQRKKEEAAKAAELAAKRQRELGAVVLEIDADMTADRLRSILRAASAPQPAPAAILG